ncbi:MAG TPA: hypothetical protein VMZ50_10755 [Phycisphaerae bacterium]|nr:hypothetical protein [Phycisphaerae bacterium]
MAIRFPCNNPRCGRELIAAGRAAGNELHCPDCGTVQTVPAAGPTPAAPEPVPYSPRPSEVLTVPPWETEGAAGRKRGMAADSLRAIVYAAISIPTMLVVLLSFIGAYSLYQLYFGPAAMLLAGACFLGFALPILGAFFGYVLGGYILRFFLDVIISSLEGVDKAPGLPRFGLGPLFVTGMMGAGLLVIYVLPIVTIPLLPLALLAAGYSDDNRALNVLWAWRAARRHPGPLLGMWAILLSWGAVLGAALWAASVAVVALANRAAQFARPVDAEMVWMLVYVPGSVVLALLTCVLFCVVFRCIGLLGRHHPEILETLPEQADSPWATAAFVAGGALAAILIHSLLLGPLLRALA